ncbi:hypothetical protein IL306_007227 [Fusarium sp. DS 682]|nr:hypothetical protein IL306_007227 [Fusarium sp. DS 682]
MVKEEEVSNALSEEGGNSNWSTKGDPYFPHLPRKNEDERNNSEKDAQPSIHELQMGLEARELAKAESKLAPISHRGEAQTTRLSHNRQREADEEGRMEVIERHHNETTETPIHVPDGDGNAIGPLKPEPAVGPNERLDDRKAQELIAGRHWGMKLDILIKSSAHQFADLLADL